jgi:NitT/TauT family transport system substrate-binding protein
MRRTSPPRSSRRRRWAAGVALATLALGLSCARPAPPLRVGANVWPGYEPLFLAKDLGLHRGHAIQLIEFSSATEVIRAYRDGLLDVAAVTGDEALLASQRRSGDRIVLVCDVSAGGDVLLARPGIASLPELRGKRVGVETTALGAYMLSRALRRGGLEPSEVQVVPLPLSSQEQAIASGAVDAVVTFEPHRTRILAAGARQLFDSSQIPGEIVDVLLARGGLRPSQEDALRELVEGWFQALAHLQAQPAEAAARASRREGLEPEQVLAALHGLRVPDRAENLRLLGQGGDGLAPVLRELSAAMAQARITPEPPALPALDPSYASGAAP